MFGADIFQTTKVIRIAQFGPQLLENLPIFLCSPSDFAGEVALQICCHAFVIQERVVHVEQEATRLGDFSPLFIFGGAKRCAL